MDNICPICSSPNNCSIAMGCPAYTCWCMSKEINESLKNIVANDRCICENCINNYNNGKLSIPQAFLKIYPR